MKIFRALASDPHQRGEQMFRDSKGREIQKWRFGLWLISYWADQAIMIDGVDTPLLTTKH